MTLAFAPSAWAQAPAPSSTSARLVYVRNAGAESCPDERAIRSAVGARLGYDPFLPEAPSTLFAEISSKGTGFAARIRLIDAAGTVRGTREITHAQGRCFEIIDTMALTMSLAIDPESLDGPRRPKAPAETEPPPALPFAAMPMANADPPPVDPLASAREAKRIHLSLGLGPTVWTGAAPSVSAGAFAFLRARRAWFSISIEGRADLPASLTLPQGTVETSLLFGSLAPCAHFSVIGLCAVGSFGSIHGTSRDVTFPRDDSSLHAALGLRARAEFRLSEVASVFGAVDAAYTLTSQRLLLNGVDVYALPRLSGGASLGLALDIF